MDSYLLVDREAENSVKYFALQLFTVPTIAEHLVQHNSIIDRLHNLIVAFFTNQIHHKSIAQNPTPDREISVESFPFRSKRFMPMFSDLRYICSNASVQTLIASDESYITNFLRLCRLFVGINPNRRMANTHVEYEQEAWISVFNVTLSLSRVVRVYAEAFGKATPVKLCNAIRIVADDIEQTCSLRRRALDRNKYGEIRFKNQQFGSKKFTVIDFDVLTGWVSFHHSEHWLLAELLKHVDQLSPKALAPTGYSSLKEVLQTGSPNDFLVVLEFPLRGMMS
jgi:E3 ubiquitin-protein ligase UBR1